MTKQPTIGTVFTHSTLGRCKVIAIHPLGTIDVQNIFTDRCYRITGLPLRSIEYSVQEWSAQ